MGCQREIAPTTLANSYPIPSVEDQQRPTWLAFKLLWQSGTVARSPLKLADEVGM
jgi:hypothetical protein